MSSASVVVRPSVVRRFLVIAVGTVVGLDILRIVLRFGFHVSSPMTIINVSWEGNLPTGFSTMLLAASALLLAVIAHVKIRQRDPYRWHWSVMALCFTIMSLDYTAGFHEMLNGLLENYSLFKGRLPTRWVAMPFVGGVGITSCGLSAGRRAAAVGSSGRLPSAIRRRRRQQHRLCQPAMLGRVGLTGDADAFILAEELGPYALDPAFDLETFTRAIHGRRRDTKSVLMDQALIAGIGNIYADEILFQARLHPKTPAASLDEGQRAELFRQIKAVLGTAIERGAGAEQLLERLPDHYLLPHRDKVGKCPRCGTSIATLKSGGRTSYFCPRCQPAPRLNPRRRSSITVHGAWQIDATGSLSSSASTRRATRAATCKRIRPPHRHHEASGHGRNLP